MHCKNPLHIHIAASKLAKLMETTSPLDVYIATHGTDGVNAVRSSRSSSLSSAHSSTAPQLSVVDSEGGPSNENVRAFVFIGAIPVYD